MTEQQAPKLPHDASGFLTGGERLINGIDEVKLDTHSILAILKNLNNRQQQAQQSVRDSLKHIGQQTKKTVEAVNQSTATLSQKLGTIRPTIDSENLGQGQVNAVVNSNQPVGNSEQGTQNPSRSPVSNNGQNRQRNSDGRFSSGEENKQGWWNKLKAMVRGGVQEANTDTHNIDPTVDAVRELGDALSPVVKVGKAMFKGAAWLFGRKKKQPPPSDQEQRQQTRIEKLLRRIADARARATGAAGQGFNLLGGIGGSLLGGLGSLLMRALIPALGLTAAFNFGQWIGGKIYEFIEPALTPLIDGIAAIPETISNAWQGVVDIASKGIEAVVEGFKAVKDKVTGAYESTVDMASKGIEKAANGVSGIVNWGKGVYNKAVDKTSQAIQGAVNTGRYVKQSIKESGRSAIDNLTGKKAERKDALVNEMKTAGITNPTEQAMFMAQMDHESGGFSSMEESFNYRSPERLMAVSKSAAKHGSGVVQAAMAQGPEAVAELMYGGRMGNTEKGDAYKFRGRGHIQLTGKAQYAAASKDLGMDLVNNPDLAADPKVAAKVATWYWKKNKLGEAAQAGDVTAVTKKINGGTNGLADRQSKFADYLTDAKTGKLTQAGQSPESQTNKVPITEVKAKSPSTVVVAKPQSTPMVDSFVAKPLKIATTPTAIPQAATPKPVPVVAAKSVPEVPKVQQQVSTVKPKTSGSNAGQEHISQNISDRLLAHAVTGGLGMERAM